MSDQPLAPDAEPDALQTADDQVVIHYQPPRKKRKRPAGKLQMTAMIDIVFNLLIFFLVATEFNPEGLLPSDLPQEGVGQASEQEVPKLPIKVRIRSVGENANDVHLAIEGTAATPGGFEQLFALLYSMRLEQGGLYEADTPVILLGRPDTYWEHMVLAYNAAVKARYENINFAPAK